MNSRGVRSAPCEGFTSVELVVAMAIVVSVFVFTLAYLHTIVRRERMKTAVREIYSQVLAARMQAVRRDANVVLQVDLARRELTTWAESAPANFVRDESDALLSIRPMPSLVSVRSVSGPANGPDGIAFDAYAGNPALVDRVVFGSNGVLVRPQASNSRAPRKPSTVTGDVPSTSVNCLPAGCRGIYLADRATGGPNRNLFRISVDDFGRVGKASLLKWLPPEQGGNAGERDFVPPPWKWVD
jgi:type II secretory pathway pseudopilin PulG